MKKTGMTSRCGAVVAKRRSGRREGTNEKWLSYDRECWQAREGLYLATRTREAMISKLICEGSWLAPVKKRYMRRAEEDRHYLVDE